MKKLLFSSLALTLILALTASATLTRVLTLGDANNIVKDEANILLYPSTINMYRGLVLGEVTPMTGEEYGSSLYNVGAHYDFGEGRGVVGMYLSKVGIPLESYQPNPPSYYYAPDGQIDNRLNLFYGRPFGETLFGMALSFYHDSYKVDGNDNDQTEQSNTALGIQVGLTMMEKLDLAAGFGYTTWTNKNAAGDDATKPESNMMIDLGGRYWYAFTDQVDFVPHLAFEYQTKGYSVPDVGKDTENMLGIDLGWGVNIRPEDRILLLFDFGINFESSTYKDEPDGGTSTELKTTDMHLPYFKVGMEGNVTKWWDVRLGAIKRWVGVSEDQTEDITEKYGSGETDTFLGSGFHFGNLTLDTWINPDFVLNGPNFVSGWQGDVAYMASIKYAWK